MKKPKTDLEKKALAIAVEHYIEIWDEDYDNDFYKIYQLLEQGKDLTEEYEEVIWDENIGVPYWNPKYLANKIEKLYKQITFVFNNQLQEV